MKTLTNGRFAPITSTPGFLHLPLDTVLPEFVAWHRELKHRSEVRMADGFPECLHLLEPLTMGSRPREMLVEVAGGWTAYFDCSETGTDAGSPVGYLTRRLHCDGLMVNTVPHTVDGMKGGTGAVILQLYGDRDMAWLNLVRGVELVSNRGGRWKFSAGGEVQPFEETERYEARRKLDRFNTDILERYCQAMGLDVFNERAYGRAALIESDVRAMPGKVPKSLERVQRDWDIPVDRADQYPG